MKLCAEIDPVVDIFPVEVIELEKILPLVVKLFATDKSWGTNRS